MHKFLQNKLWRDKTVDIMRKMGSVIHVIYLDDAEYNRQLRLKLIEEAQEICDAQERNQLIEELADLYEVVDALAALNGVSHDDIRLLQTKKRYERGGFYGRAFITVSEHPAGSYGDRYCRAYPEKYPEIIE